MENTNPTRQIVVDLNGTVSVQVAIRAPFVPEPPPPGGDIYTDLYHQEY